MASIMLASLEDKLTGEALVRPKWMAWSSVTWGRKASLTSLTHATPLPSWALMPLVTILATSRGIRDETGSNTYRWNLITTVFFLGTYEDRQETENLNWSGAFQLDNAPNTVLTGNVVAGAEQAGYKTLGELCKDTTWWMGNEVHNAIYGVMLWKKGGTGPLTDCCRLNNFYTWRISDTGFYVQHYASSLITNVVSVDSPLGAMQIIYEPDSLSHKFHPKTANASHSLFVGVSPSHTCEYQASKSRIMKFYGDKFFGGGVGGGNTGILLASFTSGSNMAPLMTFSNAGTYPALYGSTHFEGLTFHNFRDTDCGRGIALMVNPQSEDANHPAFVKGLLFLNTPQESYMYIPRPNLSSIDPSECVDMDCDGLKKVVVTDVDGSLLGEKDATVISQADWEWDGDPRRGIGDYRIPLPIRQNPDGSQIEAADKFPNKGIVRDASCAVVPSWQAWKCFSLRCRLMIIESIDTDTEVRRLSPIALIANPAAAAFPGSCTIPGRQVGAATGTMPQNLKRT
ncbi:fibrocystin-L-like [Scylla paramamosain]|uniref:fibrocystin-L-like n=1 Tax=Scylla paramamosain TaxID=85552 RepID=UPI003083E64B